MFKFFEERFGGKVVNNKYLTCCRWVFVIPQFGEIILSSD